MTSNPNAYQEWCSGQVTLPEHTRHVLKEPQAQDSFTSYWLMTNYAAEIVPGLDSSNMSSPEMSYQGPSFQPHFCNSEDYLDYQRIGTPQSTLDDDELEFDAQVGIETNGNGASKRVRRREQNRASQRAYRDRQRGKIAELQAKIVTLKAENEKLQARNSMLEATFQRQSASLKSQVVNG